MEQFFQELSGDVPDLSEVLQLLLRLALAGLCGGLLGHERESTGQSAGLRTHMLVALGSAIFVLTLTDSGASSTDIARVVQGVAAGVGFVGAGAIIKAREHSQVKGLTTAASIWLTAALGVAVGAGRLWLPIVGAAFAWVILSTLQRYERRLKSPPEDGAVE